MHRCGGFRGEDWFSLFPQTVKPFSALVKVVKEGVRSFTDILLRRNHFLNCSGRKARLLSGR